MQYQKKLPTRRIYVILSPDSALADPPWGTRFELSHGEN